MKTVLVRLVALVFLGAFLAGAYAAPTTHVCLPNAANERWVGSDYKVLINQTGGCVRWSCRSISTPPLIGQVYTYCGLTAELPKVGGRVGTIAKSADPLKSLNAMSTRFPMGDFSDPVLKALKDAMDAADKVAGTVR